MYPLTVPRGAAADSAARAGFAIFRTECIACHAINGEGGKVGPDLNVPRSIVEYRPADQIRAFVRDPQSFRYTNMPAHRHLSDAQLDALLAYFEAMSHLKRDPGRDAGAIIPDPLPARREREVDERNPEGVVELVGQRAKQPAGVELPEQDQRVGSGPE